MSRVWRIRPVYSRGHPPESRWRYDLMIGRAVFIQRHFDTEFLQYTIRLFWEPGDVMRYW